MSPLSNLTDKRLERAITALVRAADLLTRLPPGAQTEALAAIHAVERATFRGARARGLGRGQEEAEALAAMDRGLRKLDALAAATL